ncbi:HAD family hydrolase [Pseudomonas sp. NEEL19]|uniref:HAD family hydrolase n=1 Tax=Pseudomonas sp. NEEL19 TaxID=2867409 RepID=UPI0023687A63|nr:HAD family hydrolase [Pseudomonas sp. NEEL19]WDM57713.1 HAD family hydrolase [Pseudomonas sp. NEEL19]
MTTAVIFDAFGTLIEIQNRQNPYKWLLRIGSQQGRVTLPSDLRALMALNGGLREAAHLFGIKLSSVQLIELQDMLDCELESIRCFDDAMPAIEHLQGYGIKVGVCSNLAGPYCSRVRSLLPGLDAYSLSAETGALKPDPSMYRSVCDMLDVSPGENLDFERDHVLMIGDSKRCDQYGPRSYGIQGHHLDRKGTGRFQNLIEFTSAIAQGSV